MGYPMDLWVAAMGSPSAACCTKSPMRIVGPGFSLATLPADLKLHRAMPCLVVPITFSQDVHDNLSANQRSKPWLRMSTKLNTLKIGS